MKLLLPALFLLYMANTAYSQIVNYNTQDGLGFNNVDHISEDDEGLIYISTGDGLNIFDGSQFTLFNLHNTDGFSNKITQTLSLKKGLILIGTRDKGLFVWDKLKKLIIPITLEKEPLASLVDISTIFLDSNDIIWAGSYNGTLFTFPLSEIDSNTSDYHIDNAEVITTLLGGINTILEMDNTLFIGTESSKLTRIRKGNNNYIIDQPLEVGGATRISSLAVASETLYLGTDRGLYKFGGLDPLKSVDGQFLADPWKLDGTVIRSLSIHRNSIWVGTEGNGMYKFSTKGVQLEHFLYDQNKQNNLNSDYVLTSYVNSNDNLWIGTWYGGINRINIKIACFFIAIMAISMSSCADDLAELNENPNAIADLPYGLQLTKVQLNLTGGQYEMRRVALGWGASSIQQLADINTGTSLLPGDKYIDFIDYSYALYDRYFEEEAKDLVDYTTRVGKDPEAVNYHAMGRIISVISFHKMTDYYGDIPYSEAGLGFISNNWTPVYDRQQDIYMHMLSELEAAAQQFDASAKNPGTQDVLYGGDYTKWKKLSYSMMLRLGLRLVKVDPAAAESWVKKAIAGGVMTDLNDLAMFEHELSGRTSPIGHAFNLDKWMRLSDTFVSWMQDHDDPRLDLLSYVESGGPHQGLPNGLNATTIVTEGPAGSDLANYSQVNPELVKEDSPSMLITYAEVELMLAEAAVRGWYTGNAATHYNNGVRAAMANWGFYGVDTPATADVDAYLSANPFVAANGLEMIGEQYWAATFLNPWEGFSNWRRVEYPVLTPVNYSGNATGGTIPRRMKYPLVEFTVNTENVNAAISNQGPNTYTTRVWWDVKK